MTALGKIIAQRARSAELGLVQRTLYGTAERLRSAQEKPKQADQEEHAENRPYDAHLGGVAQNDIREIAP